LRKKVVAAPPASIGKSKGGRPRKATA